MGLLEGKTALVTGGSTGIGLAGAVRLAAEGAHVFITGRRQDALDAALKTIGGRVTGVRGDMADLADIDRLYDAVQQKHAQIDVVFANAGAGSSRRSGPSPRIISTGRSPPTSGVRSSPCRRPFRS